MLKYVKHHMDSILNIEIFPLISLIIFFAFFTGLTIWTIGVKKKYVDDMSHLPLDSNNE